MLTPPGRGKGWGPGESLRISPTSIPGPGETLRARGLTLRSQMWPCPHGLLWASTHEAHTEHGRGSAAMGKEQPHSGAPCRLQMCVTKPSHLTRLLALLELPWPEQHLGLQAVPREGATSWDRAVDNSKCRCWSLLWSRPGYPAWQPSHFSETLSVRLTLEDQRKNSSRSNFSFKSQEILPSLELHLRVQINCGISEAPCSVSSSSSPSC